MGTADGVPRAVHALRALHRQAARPLALSRAGRDRPRRAARALRRGRWTRRSSATRSGSRRCRSTSRARYPKSAGDSDAVHRAAIRAKALDTLRGMLPAATQSNVGIYGTGQAYEALLLRMRAHPLEEVRACADAMLAELRKVIPAFLARVDLPERGGRWSDVSRRDARRARRPRARRCSTTSAPEPRAEVTLTDFDPDGEVKVVAAALYAVSDLPDDQLLAIARRMTPTSAPRCCAPTSASATNRRHRPGRAFERTAYRFDVLTDYGAFRDLQRHRLLTLDWQPLTPRHGYTEPEAIARGRRAATTGDGVMEASAELHDALAAAGLDDVGAVRRRDGLPRPLLHGHERARGDARHRAAHRAAGASRLPPRLPADAPADRRAGRPSRDRRRRCGSPITPRSSWSGSGPSARSSGSARGRRRA